MYNQTGNLYKGVFDCLYKTIRTEGLLAIYKGYVAHLARILPHTVRLHHSLLEAQPLTWETDSDPDFGRTNEQADSDIRIINVAGVHQRHDMTWRESTHISLHGV